MSMSNTMVWRKHLLSCEWDTGLSKGEVLCCWLFTTVWCARDLKVRLIKFLSPHCFQSLEWRKSQLSLSLGSASLDCFTSSYRFNWQKGVALSLHMLCYEGSAFWHCILSSHCCIHSITQEVCSQKRAATLPHRFISDNSKTCQASAKAITALLRHKEVQKYLSTGSIEGYSTWKSPFGGEDSSSAWWSLPRDACIKWLVRQSSPLTSSKQL